MQERRNYYRILGVQPDAPVDIIRGAYRTLMQKLRHHPDLGGDERHAASINKAWRVLRDPRSRDRYDRQLLAAYEISMVASAGNPLIRPVSGTATSRRNYYRILGVQSDAPQALIHAAYRAGCGTDSPADTMIAEAYAVLGDPAKRRRYDESPDDPGPVETDTIEPEAAAPQCDTAGPVGAGQRDAYRPLIRSYCLFCKTPYSPYPGGVPMTLCRECESPLQALPPDDSQTDRTFRRLDLSGVIEFYEYWPGPPGFGHLQEFTPQGLRLVAQKRLDPGQVVRVSAAVFDAVAKVVHCNQCEGGFSAGMELVTARFGRHGVFIDIRS